MKTIYTLCLAVLLCLVTLTPALARDITLSWDASSDSNVVGYKVYYQGGSATLPLSGTDATNGTSPINVGDVTTYTITGLSDSQIYYFAVSAYDASGLESSLSPEVASQWVPTLTFPADGAASLPANVQLLWGDPPTGAGTITYTLYYGTSPSLGTAAPVGETTSGSGMSGKVVFAAIAFFGLLLPAIPRRRLKRRFAPAAVATALLLCACGGGGGGTLDTLSTNGSGTTSTSSSSGTSSSDTGSSSSAASTGTVVVTGLSDTTYDLTNLAPSTTYYWKVVASDGQNTMESATSSFTTDQY